MRSGRMVFVVMLFAAAVTGTAAGQDLTDPYEILGHYFEASGGLETLRAERTQYFEGILTIGGMEGSIKAWTQKPDLSKLDIQIGPISVIEGDNGEFRWMLDTNGKLQRITKTDDATLKRRDVDRRMAEYEYADPGSDVFTVSLEGTETVGETHCYVVKVANNINVDLHTFYISVDGFRLEKSVDIIGENSADTYFGDYRAVDGVLVAFYFKRVAHQTGQPQEVTISAYESNPELDPAVFDPPEVSGKDFEFASGNAAEDVPFEFIGYHLFIPVKVGGTERLWILDTGAAMSVLDQAFADELGLESEGDLKGRGAAGTVDVTFAKLPPYEVAGIRFNEQTVAVIDMKELVRRLGVDIAGILGFDFLSRFVTRVDYVDEMISFYDPDTFEYSGDGRLVDVHIKESVFEAQATLDEEHSGTWLFDLGAGSTHLDGVYARREGYAEQHGVLRMGHGAGNEYQLKAMKADSIQFGGFTLYDPYISFAYGGTDTVFTSDRLGILGNTLFRNFVVYVDYAKEQLILEKGKRFNQPWPEDRSGLNVGWTVDRDGIEVIYVSPDTPAEEAGFEKGDVIKSVNGAAVEPMGGVIALREMLKEEPGTVHKIVIDRGGREKMVNLTLADLY